MSRSDIVTIVAAVLSLLAALLLLFTTRRQLVISRSQTHIADALSDTWRKLYEQQRERADRLERAARHRSDVAAPLPPARTALPPECGKCGQQFVQVGPHDYAHPYCMAKS